MSIIKFEFEKEINDLKTALLLANDGVITTAGLSASTTNLIRERIAAANATTSIDERISILASGLQDVVSYSEEYCENLKEQVDRLKDKIEYLSKFAEKIDVLIEEEKKSSTIVEEQKI